MTGGRLVPENDPVGQPRKPVRTDNNNHHNDNNHHNNIIIIIISRVKVPG